MRQAAWALVLAAFLPGCDQGDDGPGWEDTGVCTPRTGLYRASYTLKSGSCGPIDDGVINANDDPAAAGCTGTAVSADQCGTFEMDASCPLAGQPYRVVSRGKITWPNDAQRGTARELFVQVVGTNGAVECSGFYDLTITKI